ncbi:MAG: metallophosphoesterase [Candidatus Bipolaricaulota bacterium]
MLKISLNRFKNLVFGLVLLFALTAPGSGVVAQEELPGVWGPYLTLTDESTFVVNWRAENGPETVYYDRASYFLEKNHLREKVSDHQEGEVFHHVSLSDLRPGTKYVYRIGQSPGQFGLNYFKTPKSEPEEFTFFVYGDTRTCPERHRLVASEMALNPSNPAFIVHTGDLVESPVSPNWADFFWAIEPFSGSIPLVPVLGNHEKNDDSYYESFALPSGGGDYEKQWYSFEYGKVNFIVLDSNADLMGLNSFLEEKAWLEKELENQTRPFTVVMFHHPMFSSKYSNGKDAGLESSWGSLFEKYGVELVFNGHVHSYERLEKNGVTYVVTGGGGAPTGRLNSGFEFSKKAHGDSLHYVRVRVKNEEMKLQMLEVAKLNRSGEGERVGCNVEMDVNRRLIDETVIEKLD